MQYVRRGENTFDFEIPKLNSFELRVFFCGGHAIKRAEHVEYKFPSTLLCPNAAHPITDIKGCFVRAAARCSSAILRLAVLARGDSDKKFGRLRVRFFVGKLRCILVTGTWLCLLWCSLVD